MDALIEGIFALLRLALWAVCFLGAAVLSPPVIAVWTKMDGSQPYWPTFWRRYRKALFEMFATPP